MNFSEQPPSKQWAALKYRGDKFAEVWFKPEGEPFALLFRIPQTSFQAPGMAQLLSTENLLKAVAIPPDEVESWYFIGASHSSTDETNTELATPLPPPSRNMTHLTVQVSLKPPAPIVPSPESAEPETVEGRWQALEARWKAIEGLEATVDTLRIRLEGLRVQMEASTKAMLTAEEKLHALNADVSCWNKAKSRVHFALPKLREFTHRAIWALGTPERKQLEELFNSLSQTQVPLAQLDKMSDQLESLLKDRQILCAQGVSVSQECQSIFAEVEGTLRTLKNNAAANARKKQNAGRAKGKFFKDVRRWTGVE